MKEEGRRAGLKLEPFKGKSIIRVKKKYSNMMVNGKERRRKGSKVHLSRGKKLGESLTEGRR